MSSRFDRARDLLDVGGRDRRYPEAGETRDLERVSDPETFRDEGRESLREKFFRYRWFFLAFGAVLLFGSIIFINWILTFVPALLLNIWVQRFLVFSFIFSGAVFLGSRWAIGSIRDVDEVSLLRPDGLTTWRGVLEESKNGNYPVLKPIRGYRFFGLLPVYYKIRDLSPQFARQLSKRGHDLDDPVKIRLHPYLCETTETDWGSVASQLSSGLDVDQYGRETHLVAGLPEMADESRISDMSDQLRELYEKLRNARDRAETFRIQRNRAFSEAKQSRREALEEFTDLYQKIREVDSSRRGSRRDLLGDEPDEIDMLEEELIQDGE